MKPQDNPPPNRAIGWYRFMLWLMPTCIALTTAVGLGWLSVELGWDGSLPIISWFVFNTITTLGIAAFEAKLRSRPGRPVSLKTDAGIIQFFLLQLLIVPTLTMTLLLTVCLAGAY